MKRNLLALVFYCVLCTLQYAFAQNPLVKQWDKRFGGTLDELLLAFQQTDDGGYVIGGQSGSGIGGDKTQASKGSLDYWIIKTDMLGNKQWDKDYGGIFIDNFSSLQQIKDGGYILGGHSRSGIGADKTQNNWDASGNTADYWIIKINSIGNKQWDKRFGGTDNDLLYSLQQTNDGGYILGGSSQSALSGNKTEASQGGFDYWIVKTDSIGNYQWDKRFGGTDNDLLYSLQQTNDGGYILGGMSYSGIGGDKTQASWGAFDFWVIKTDSLGNKQWDRRYGGIDDDRLFTLLQSSDGGYLLGGWSHSGISGNKTQTNTDASNSTTDYWIVKIDSFGNKQWDKGFGGLSDDDGPYKLYQTPDKGYLISGSSDSPLSGDKTESNLGISQSWILKTDSSGIKLWDKTIFTLGRDEIGLAIQTTDGCYVIANADNGGIGGYRTQSSQGKYDYWIIKFCDSTNAALPMSNFISSDTLICDEGGKCINFLDHSTNSPTSWKWLFPGAVPNFSNQQNPTNICYYTAGTYAVTLIVSNAAGSDTLTVSPMITVGGTPPVPSIIVSNDTLFCSHASSYQWYYNGVPINGATDSSYYASNYGSYNVEIRDSLGCSRLGSSVVAEVGESTGYGLQFTVYPNPVADQFTVYGFPDSYRDGTTLDIYNVLGEKVFSQYLILNTPYFDIDISALAKGIYVVQCSVGDRLYRAKFVKE